MTLRGKLGELEAHSRDMRFENGRPNAIEQVDLTMKLRDWLKERSENLVILWSGNRGVMMKPPEHYADCQMWGWRKVIMKLNEPLALPTLKREVQKERDVRRVIKIVSKVSA